ncbi:MAG: SPOR domain-containing protein [Gammaproteobacteria bacterium]|nr:MAG: SPOR domain-containing protein [Gammaproteobacteria bacterium]
MERRQHNRIPVELNAVLIGEKTVPKGCKVDNISEQGLLLTCVADGRVSTFQKGNIVNVHLLFQQSGSCKYLTKSGKVRHAGENSIGVEFHQPDSKLLEFLKPSRTDSNQNLDTASADISASVSEGIDMHKATNADFIDKPPGATTVTTTREPAIPKEKDRKVSHAVPAFLLLATGLVLGAYLYITNINSRINALETVTEKHTSELAEVQEWALPASMLEGKFAYLNAQMKALTDSFTKLANRLNAESVHPPVKIVAQAETAADVTGSQKTTASPASLAAVKQTEEVAEKMAADTVPETTAAEPPVAIAEKMAADTVPETTAAEPPVAIAEKTAADTVRETTAAAPPAAVTEKAAADTLQETTAAESPTVITEKTAADTIQETTAASPPAAITEKTAADTIRETTPAESPAAKAGAVSGRWVINLSSSPDKAAADWFMAKARSKGIPVDLVKAEVKGRDYWRVQLTGFVSKDAAYAYAGPLKEKLGMKDVWIFKK